MRGVLVRSVFGGVVGLLLGCGGLGEMETSYQWRLQSIDEVSQKVDPAKRAEILAAKAAFQAEYATLPQDPEQRSARLGPLNQKMRAFIDQMESYASQVAAQQQAAAGAQMDAYRQQFVGHWQGGGMDLTISPGGHVSYRRESGGGTRSVDAPIQAFGPTSFEVGFMGITTTFRIDRPPHEENGVFKMTIDGVELTRVP